jgi:hypothetical protein
VFERAGGVVGDVVIWGWLGWLVVWFVGWFVGWLGWVGLGWVGLGGVGLVGGCAVGAGVLCGRSEVPKCPDDNRGLVGLWGW